MYLTIRLLISFLVLLPNLIDARIHPAGLHKAKTDKGLVNAIIEISAGSNQKWEYNQETGKLEWQTTSNGLPQVIPYLPIPFNYGIVAQTYIPKSHGGDGDALDIIVLSERITKESVVPVRIIGVILMTNDKEIDNKLIGIPETGPFKMVYSLKDLKHQFPGVTTIIKSWFKNTEPNVKIKGIKNKKEADKILHRAITYYTITTPF